MPEVPAIQPLDNPLTGLIRLQELQGLAQERQMRGQEFQALAQERQARAQQLQQAQDDQRKAQQALAGLPRNEDGTIDPGGAWQALNQAGLSTDHQSNVIKTIEGMNASARQFRQDKLNHWADVSNTMLEGHSPENPVTEDSVHSTMAFLRMTGGASQEDEDHFNQIMAQKPDPEQMLKTVRSLGDKWKKPPEIKEVPAGGSLVSISPGGGAQTIFQGAAKAPTAEEDNAKAIGLLARQNQGQSLSADDQAWLKAYQTQRLQGPEASAVAAAERQGRSIEAAAARQAESERARIAADTRRQTFQEQESGRDKLTKEETKYHDALAQAQALRDTVASAQAGNKVAASMQSLETAMAAIRAQGLNRINAVEIGMPASAGNAWDRIQGWFGKATEGQPVPKDIQKDMTDFATMLERTAYNKYSTSHKSITGRYNLRDETPEPAPPSTVTGGPRTGGKGDPLGIR